jgi:hypothetical protein
MDVNRDNRSYKGPTRRKSRSRSRSRNLSNRTKNRTRNRSRSLNRHAGKFNDLLKKVKELKEEAEAGKNVDPKQKDHYSLEEAFDDLEDLEYKIKVAKRNNKHMALVKLEEIYANIDKLINDPDVDQEEVKDDMDDLIKGLSAFGI